MDKNEPLITVASVTAVITAVVGLLVAFGVPLTDEQQTAILAVVAAVAPLAVGLVARQLVTPNGKVVEYVVGSTVVAGQANERVDAGESIRQLDDSAEFEGDAL